MQIIVNGESRRQADRISVLELLESLSLEPARAAVELNKEIVSRARYGDTYLKDRDRLEIVTLVGGG